MPYGIRMFEVGDIHTLIDIGAHRGVMATRIFDALAPNRIIALEPCKETFEGLLETSKNLGDFFECYNVAYGCGEDLYYLYKSAEGMRRFLTKKEREYWIIPDDVIPEYRYPYPIESKTLKDIFQDYNIDFDKPYMIKMDCEGCERFLLENEEDLLYLKNATLFTAELHFFGYDFDGTPREESNKYHEFASWIFDNFFDTHDVLIGNQKTVLMTQDDMPKMISYFSAKKFRYVKLISKEFLNA